MSIFKQDGLYGYKSNNGETLIDAQYIEFYPFRCGLACVRNQKYQYGYIDIMNRPIVYFGKYIWIDPFFTNGYARVKLLDNKNWGVIDTFGRIAVFPNLEYIWPLKSEKSPIKGWRDTTTIKGKYKGEIVGYLIDQMSVVNLPIDFEFEPDIDLEDIINPQPQSRGQHDEKIRHFTTYAPDYEEWEDYERPEYEDYIDDAFEGDPSAYWNID